MRLIATTLALAMGASAAAEIDQGTVTLWNFNGPSATTVPGGNLSPAPAIGFGTASLVGGTTADPSFGSGTSNGGSSDPVVGTPTDYAWQTTSYAPQGQQNNGRGVQFMVSTVNFDKIIVQYDLRHSNTSSRWEQFLYTLDGGVNWSNAGLAGGGLFEGPSGDTWFNNRTIDLTSIAGAANNANFGFRVVATFGPSGGYEASNGSSNYATTGTWRFDMVEVIGNTIPSPGALALLGVAGLVSRRRR